MHFQAQSYRKMAPCICMWSHSYQSTGEQGCLACTYTCMQIMYHSFSCRHIIAQFVTSTPLVQKIKYIDIELGVLMHKAVASCFA